MKDTDRPDDMKRYVHESATEMVQLVLPNDTNVYGNVLGGRVMHWIDLAGAIAANRHCRKPVVTASMDALDFHSPIRLGQTAILKAVVNYAGRTSMEVGVEVFSEDPLTGKKIHTSSAYITYVALDNEGRPAKVPDLLLSNEDERLRYEEAKERKRLRLERLSKSDIIEGG